MPAMKDKIFAVIDTNVIVSALLSSNLESVIKAIITDGLNIDRTPAADIEFPDPKDIVFYEVALSVEDSYLVTGNIRHFPVKPFVVTPAEMVRILED